MVSKKSRSKLLLVLSFCLAIPGVLNSCGQTSSSIASSGKTSSVQTSSAASSSKTVSSSTAASSSKANSSSTAASSAASSQESSAAQSSTESSESSVVSSVADDPTDPVDTTPVIDTLSEYHVALPDTIEEGAVWTPGPLYFGESLFSIDSKVEYAKGAKSLRVNLNKSTEVNKESGFILPFSGLTEGQTYKLTFYAQGSKTYNGCLSQIMANPNYTFATDAGEVKTMLDLSVDAAKLFTAGDMTAADWTKMTISFTAHPKEGICSLRTQLTTQTGWIGQLWLSYFEVTPYTAPVVTKDTPQVTAPVLSAIPADAVAVPDALPEGGVWEAGPLYSGNPVFAIDSDVEYATGGKSISVDFNKAVVGTESVLILPFKGLTSGAKYTLSFYIQGSTNFNGSFSDIFENPNYTTVVDGSEVRTMLKVTKDLGSTCTAGGLLNKGWDKVTLNFTANPKDDFCSLRIQFRKVDGWVGTAWISGFEMLAKDVPQVTAPVVDTLAADHVALPDSIPTGGVWEAGPLYSGDNIFSIDSDVEYAKGAKSIAVDFNKATVGTEDVIILPFKGLTSGSKYALTFYVQGSTKFNGSFSDIFESPNYTTVVDGAEVRTMLNVTRDLGTICTAGGLLDKGWVKATINFTANPKDDICSLRFQLKKADGWVGTAWISYFEAALQA
jgi:hypothetical protein